MNNTLIGGTGWVYYETVAGGQGGRPGRAGMSGVQTGMTNTKNTPIEALERAFPHAGAPLPAAARAAAARARAPGGEGIERDLEMLEDVTVSLITERRVVAARGAWRAADPAPPARTGCSRAATRPGPNACPTSARSACRPATCSASSPPAAAVGQSLRPGRLAEARPGSAGAAAGEEGGDGRHHHAHGEHRLQAPPGAAPPAQLASGRSAGAAATPAGRDGRGRASVTPAPSGAGGPPVRSRRPPPARRWRSDRRRRRRRTTTPPPPGRR